MVELLEKYCFSKNLDVSYRLIEVERVETDGFHRKVFSCDYEVYDPDTTKFWHVGAWHDTSYEEAQEIAAKAILSRLEPQFGEIDLDFKFPEKLVRKNHSDFPYTLSFVANAREGEFGMAHIFTGLPPTEFLKGFLSD